MYDLKLLIFEQAMKKIIALSVSSPKKSRICIQFLFESLQKLIT